MKTPRFDGYLADRLEGAQDVRLSSVRRSFPGISRETWMVEAEWQENGAPWERGFVFRMDTIGGSICPTPLRREYEVYRRLAGTAVPVPRALWYESDRPEVADGRDFYVREMLDGASEVPNLFDDSPAFDELRGQVGRELVSKLAALHTLDWLALGFDEVFEVPPDPATSAAFDLDLWEEIFDRERVDAYPLIRRLFAWLRHNPPPPAPRVCLLKGNNGLSEELWRGATIVGMTDWELAHLGDPVEDWVSIELNSSIGGRGIDPRFDEPALRSHYQDLTGFELSEESLRYHRAVRSLKSMVNGVSAARILAGGSELRGSTTGMAIAPHRAGVQMLRDLTGVGRASEG